MFERFTDRARRACVIAAEEARQLHHDHIGPEHLLLGLTKAEGVAAVALLQVGIGYERAHGFIEARVGRGEREPSTPIPFTVQSKKILELSLREALQLGHNYIGTEHLVLAIVRDGVGVAAELITSNGATLTNLRQAVIEILSGYQGKPDPTGKAEKLPPFWAAPSSVSVTFKPTEKTEEPATEAPVKCLRPHVGEAGLRLEALKQATGNYRGSGKDEVVAVAQVFYAFLSGGTA